MAGSAVQTPGLLPARPPIERRVVAALEAAPSRIPVVVGGCGSGRTSVLRRVALHLARRGGSQYIDVERAASTPEGFLAAVTADSPYANGDDPRLFRDGRRSAREAFEALLRLLGRPARRAAAPPAFLIDGLLELRTFESFPGLRSVLGEFLDALQESPNRFALASRYVARTLRLLRGRPDRFEVIHLPRLSPAEAMAAVAARGAGRTDAERNDAGRLVHALADGRPVYVDRLAAALSPGGSDPVRALAAQLAPGAPLYWICRFSYELRLHRARGYGALKAILGVLADEEPLTLTAVASRLGRTPGSTRDYLAWLEDVDLVGVRQKRFSFADPLLRLWVRLHCRPAPPESAVLAREVEAYATSRLPHADAAPAAAALPAAATPEPVRRPRKSWGFIEID